MNSLSLAKYVNCKLSTNNGTPSIHDNESGEDHDDVNHLKSTWQDTGQIN